MLRLPLALIAAAGLFVSAEAAACEAHAKKSQASSKQEKSEKAPTPSSREASSAASPADAIDAAMAGKCACSGASDCTCKKGSCECPRCGNRRRSSEPLYESLKGTRRAPGIDNARYDASAGVFI